MRRSRILLWGLREPESRYRNLVGTDEDCRPVGKAGTQGGAWVEFRQGAVNCAGADPEGIVHHRTQLFLFLTRELVAKNGFGDLAGGLHGRIFRIVIGLTLLLALRRLGVLQRFGRFAPSGLKLIHHPGSCQSPGSACDQTLPEMTISVVHFTVPSDFGQT